jgi:hypothetical protein
MSMTPANAKKAKFTLRYPPDKVLNSFTGSFAAATRTGAFQPKRTKISFAHGITAVTPSLRLRWKTTGDWIDGFTEDYATGGVTQALEVGCNADATNIYVFASNWTASSPTVSYEIEAFI